MNRVVETLHHSKSRLTQLILRNKLMASSLTVMALVVGGLFWSGVFDAPDPQGQTGAAFIKPVGSEVAYVGSEVCQSCHPHESRLYMASPHAHTLHAILPGQQRPEFGSPATVFDPVSGVHYAVQQGQGQHQVVAITNGTPEVAEARWAFGSGTHAWTYLAQDGSRFRQLRITYYPPTRTWNFTPGNGPDRPSPQALGDAYTPVQTAACFGCHSTVLTGSRRNLDLAHSRLNVGCESCHGPCRQHVESMTSGRDTARAAPANGTAGASNATAGAGNSANDTSVTEAALVTPPTHNNAQIMQLCGTCHRMPVTGDDQHIVSDIQIARFPRAALVRSRCFIASASKLSCITCHNPHQSTQEQQMSSFEAKCLSCHTAPHGTPCTQGHRANCVSCHMALQNVGGELLLYFHNHWIRKPPRRVAAS